MAKATSTADGPAAPIPTARNSPFNPPEELARLREQQPICRLAYPDGHVGWLVTSHQLVRAVLADLRFSSRRELQRLPVHWPAAKTLFGRQAPPGFFLAMDPPEHTRYRRLLTGQFTVRRMNQLRPRIEQIVEGQLDAMEETGPPADLVEAFALPVPSLTICELLGVPYADHELFQRNNETLVDMSSTVEAGQAAWQEVTSYLHDLVRAKRARPTDDVLGGLIDTGELTDDELVGIAVLLLLAGFDSTANILALGTFALLSNPEQAALVRTDPSSIGNVAEELVRYISVLQFTVTRTALEDVELAGRPVRAGDSVTLSLPAANRDPEKFHNPDKLDVTRDTKGHVGFGHGIHQCIGQQLARIELQAGFEGLFRRFPSLVLAVPPEEIPLHDEVASYGVHRLPVTWWEP